MENKASWLSKLKSIKLKKEQLLIVLLVGVLLVIIAMPVSKKEESIKETEDIGRGNDTDNAYESSVERRLETALMEVAGVGNTKVMVTLKTSSERIIEKDAEDNDQNINESDKEGGKRTTSENSHSETTIYDSTEQGEQTPYISKEISPKIEGVIVIAQGGADAVVIKNITDAVQALFDVDTHKIKIMKMESRK